MRRKRLVVAFAAAVASLAAPAGGAVASPTVRLAISHVVSHCHVWRTPTKLLGPSTKIAVTRGTRIVIRSDCPMDFDFVQMKGPRLSLGDPRTYAGASRTLMFRKAGSGWWVIDAKGNKARITIPNVMQSNGVIHVVDAMLMP